MIPITYGNSWIYDQTLELAPLGLKVSVLLGGGTTALPSRLGTELRNEPTQCLWKIKGREANTRVTGANCKTNPNGFRGGRP